MLRDEGRLWAAPVRLGEVLFEFQRVGRVTRVTAIDPASNTEITMIGVPGHSQLMVERLATRKLAYVIGKKHNHRNSNS